MQVLSEDDLDLREMADEELERAWDLWFDLAQYGRQIAFQQAEAPNPVSCGVNKLARGRLGRAIRLPLGIVK